MTTTTTTSGSTPASAPDGAPEPKGAIDRFFGITRAGSNIPRELRAGLTTFLAMSYVIIVNPSVLSTAIVVPGVDNVFVQLIMATCLAAALGTLAMGLIARYPFAQAPGMGLNAFFAFTAVGAMGFSWQEALAAVFVSGVLFVVLSVIGVRRLIVQALPNSLKFAITAGIGAFLAFLGLKSAGIVVANEATLVGLGDLHDPQLAASAWLAIVGVVVIGVLMKLNVKGSILWGILLVTALAIVFRAPVYQDADGNAVAFQGFANGIVGLPVWPSDLAFQLDFASLFTVGFFQVIFTFFFVDFFDATGTLTGLSQRAGYLDEQGNMPRAKTVFSMDGLAAMMGALLGTSTTTAYVESAAGVEEGGRTGLTSTFTGVLFALSMFLWPIITVIPGAATAPALIIVGALMMEGVSHIEWKDISDSLPAFLTVIAMPLTFSIANGVSFGIIAYSLIKVLSGKWREAHWMLYLLAALLLLRYVFFVE